MSDEKWTRDQKIAAVASAAAVVSVTFSLFAPMANADGPLYTILNTAASMGIGVFLGYALTRMLYNQKLAEKDAEIERVKAERTADFLDLQLKQLAAIRYGIAKGGTFAVPADSDLARELQALKKLGYADTPDGSIFGSYWHVTAEAENAIRNDGACWKLLEESAYYGRFNDDGEYVEVQEEIRGNLRK